MEEDEPAGVPEWVVTYGDMMSLLLTFFIMLVSLSEVVADKKYRAILDALQRYVGYRTGPISPPGQNFPLNSVVARLKTLGSHTNDDDKTARGGVKTRGPQGEDFRVFRTPEGIPRRAGSPIAFAPGSAVLSEEARRELVRIAAELAGKPNKVEIRAHCGPDPLPADSPFRDKLELTYERGRAIRDFLLTLETPIAPERMRIAAAADHEPLGRTVDRLSETPDRAEILILDAYASDFVGPKDDLRLSR